MDERTLIQHFRHIISFASLAYTFTTLHTIQYSMRNLSDNNDTTAQTTEDHDSTNFSASSSTHDTPAIISTENIEKTNASASGRWTENEISLLLDYVEANCVLKTARGLSLKKSEFNKARATVKSKDAGQCHYKWGHVRIFVINKCFHHRSSVLVM
jgi:hypothetical protein